LQSKVQQKFSKFLVASGEYGNPSPFAEDSFEGLPDPVHTFNRSIEDPGLAVQKSESERLCGTLGEVGYGQDLTKESESACNREFLYLW